MTNTSLDDNLKNGLLSLTHIARLKCINNAHIINDIGSTPYHLIEPVLMKKTAKSLKQLEAKSPQIISDSEPLWKALIKRDFPDRPNNQTIFKNGKKNNIPSRILYDKYLKEREQQRLNAAHNIKQITKNLKEMKNRNKVKALNKVLPSNKPKLNYSNNNNTHVFKSNLLQKARVLNKQRVRNFSNLSNNHNKVINTNLGLVKINKSLNNNIIKPLNNNDRKMGNSGCNKRQRIDLSDSKNSMDNNKRQKPTNNNLNNNLKDNNVVNKEKSKKSKSYIYIN